LDEKIVGLILQGTPCAPQTLIEELARGDGIAGQPARQIRRAVAVVGVDVPDQRFRRAESSLDGRKTEAGQQNQQCSDNLRHRGLALFAALLIVRLRTHYH
jgi:hypothetical protein